MRKTLALAACVALAAAACGSDDDGGGSGSSPPTGAAPAATEPAPAATDAATEVTQPEPEPEPEPTTTLAPETTTTTPATTTTEPPPPLKVVGLVPLPGAQLDFSAQPVDNPSLVWSLYSGSGGGVIIENIGGPLPPGCYITTFFDIVSFEPLEGFEALAPVGSGDACDAAADNIGTPVGVGVAFNDGNIIITDFGGLPAANTYVIGNEVNLTEGGGVFRSDDPDDVLVVNDLDDEEYRFVNVTGPFANLDDFLPKGFDAEGAASPGPGCDEGATCLQNGRMQTELSSTKGPGAAVASSDVSVKFALPPGASQVLVSVLNACEINDHFWVFAAAATDVEYELTVTDTSNGASMSYTNPAAGEAIVDTQAFATCP